MGVRKDCSFTSEEKYGMKWLFTCMIAATACGGSAQGENGDKGSNALSPACPGVGRSNGEDGGLSQQLSAGDPDMSVEALPLPTTDAVPTGGDVVAGQFLFRNFRDRDNAATRVCIRIGGTGALENVESLWFDVIPGALESASFTGQEITDVICEDSPFSIGAGGNITLVVGIRLFSGAVPGATYTLEIASPEGVTLGDPSQDVTGAFPVGGEPLTVIPARC
jgi:hypothetical protein